MYTTIAASVAWAKTGNAIAGYHDQHLLSSWKMALFYTAVNGPFPESDYERPSR